MPPYRATLGPPVLDLSLRKRLRHPRKPRMERTDVSNGRSQQKPSLVRATYHPFLFALITCSALAELGLTAFLVSAGNEHNTWPSPRYHALLILFLFNASWTTLFSTTYVLWFVDGATHFLANIASSVVWLLITSVLWGTAAGIMHNTRTGSNCAGRATISRCRQSLTVEALGWTEFGLCVLTMVATCLWVSRDRHSFRSNYYVV
ncbi:hypothetical protein LshimejAT787_0304640 [Lyophyllum shimeji]|uniref:MARVEL domain-containing protein n=1 Tax=Lyophyllum shimeji TaxID=47721 RepID=A0A9P3UMC3_LYOSH|nr:hypothetical protein LshimejAT787_0304640 [Lyophyllum shimeji]